MLFADLRAAEHQAATACSIDQRPGLVAFGVLEGRPAGLAAQRLARLARGGDAVHLGLDRLGRIGMTSKGRGDDDRAFGQFGMAIGVMQVGQRQCLARAIAQHDLAIDENILDLAAIGTAVHPHEAADGAGDRAQEFEAADARIARGRGDENARCPCPASQRHVIDPLDLGEGLAEPHDDAGNAAITYDEVGTEAECHDGDLGVEIAQELREILRVLRLEQPFCRATGLEPHERC